MDRLYKLYGINTAIDLLRPDAIWQFNGREITMWDDPRPKPSMEEINFVMDKIKQMEDSIPTMWTDDQLTRLGMNIPHMFANQLMKLTTDEISLLNSLSSNQIPALSTDQVAALSTSQI